MFYQKHIAKHFQSEVSIEIIKGFVYPLVSTHAVPVETKLEKDLYPIA